MSIVYGSFGQILTETVSSGNLSGNGKSEVFFSIPWTNASIIRDINIIADPNITAGSGVSIMIPYNNSHVYASKYISTVPVAGLGFSKQYQMYVDGLSEPGNSDFVSAANLAGRGEIGAYVFDQYNRNYLNVAVRINALIQSPISVKVSGQKIYPTSYTQTDNNGLEYLKDLSVVLSRGGIVYDVTSFAKSTGSANNRNDFFISSANDYIYVGTTKKASIYDFKIASPSTGTGTSLKAQFWNGSSWSDVRVLDNTSSDMIRNTFRYSGIVELNDLSSLGTSWTPTTLNSSLNAALIDDPATTLEKNIKAGNAHPIGMFVNPQRYWVRFNNFGLTEKIQLASLLPVS